MRGECGCSGGGCGGCSGGACGVAGGARRGARIVSLASKGLLVGLW